MNQDIRDALPDWLYECLQIPGAKLNGFNYVGSREGFATAIMQIGNELVEIDQDAEDHARAFLGGTRVTWGKPPDLPAAIRRALGITE